MTRMSKQAERREKSPRRTKAPQPKTGPKKENLPGGFKEQKNTVSGDISKIAYIPKIK